MKVVAMPRRHRKVEEDEEYRHQMLVNALAASFMALMIVAGCWIINALVVS